MEINYSEINVLNNWVIIEPDDRNQWLYDSQNKPFLHHRTTTEFYQHNISSGKVINHCKHLTADYMYGTTMELQKGDIVIFHYNAIERNHLDPAKQVPKNKFGNYYFIKYSHIFVAVRPFTEGGNSPYPQVIPVNGWCILEGNEVEYKSKLLIPDYLKRAKSEMICTLLYQGTPLTYYKDGINMDFVDTDEYEVGQKVIIPAHKAIPLQKEEHAVIGTNKLLFRCHRKDMTDYNWFYKAVKDIKNEKDNSELEKTRQAFKDFKLGSTEESEGTVHIVHKQTTKHIPKSNRIFVP